jgi:peroxiredoxin (alkyl hydroperoxide reductase subunit C)
MLGVGQNIGPFKVTGVKPHFNDPEEGGVSAFQDITEETFGNKWKVIYYFPKCFTVVCPTEIVAFANLVKEFEKRNTVVMGGSTDNEFCHLAWRKSHPDLTSLNHWSFADTMPAMVGFSSNQFRGNLIDQLGVRDLNSGVALRATYIIDPNNVVQHVSVNNLDVGRNPEETLRILDALQTGELCGCSREIGGCTL